MDMCRRCGGTEFEIKYGDLCERCWDDIERLPRNSRFRAISGIDPGEFAPRGPSLRARIDAADLARKKRKGE